jgi:hypothetical protein
MWTRKAVAVVGVAVGIAVAIGTLSLSTALGGSARNGGARPQPPTSGAGTKAGLKPGKGVYWAVVAGDGTLTRGGKGTLGAALINNPGGYQVIFSKDVSKCAYVAVLGPGGASTAGPGYTDVASLSDNAAGVFVDTVNPSGTYTNFPFHLIVSC